MSPIRRKLSLTILFFMLLGGGVFWFIQTAQGVNRTWDCGGGDSSWDNDLNWSGDTEPGVSDIAIFDATCTTSATIDKSISVAGISINSGYTGTITQSSTYTVTVGTSGFSQAAGTFTGGSGTIAISGAYTLSGGAFTGTSGTLSILSTASFTHTAGGTFTHNNGTVSVSLGGNGTFTFDVASTETFYNLSTTAQPGFPVVVSAGDTLVVLGTYTHTDGTIDTGTIEARGNVVVASTADGGSATLSFLVAGDQTITGNGGKTGGLNINKPSGTLSAGSTDLRVSGFTLSSGTFTSTSGTLSMPSQYSFTHTAGGTFTHNNGTVSVVPGSNNVFTFNVASTETFFNLSTTSQPGFSVTISTGDTLVVLGTLTQSDGTIDTGTIEARGNVVVASTADGGSATLSFTGSNDQIYTDWGGNEPDGDITINKSGGTVTLASNADWNATNQDLTITAGTLFAPDKSISTTALTIGASGVLAMMGGQTLTLGGALSNSGTVKIWGSGVCGGGDNALIRSSSGGTQRSWSGAGTFTIYDANIQDQGGSATITAYSSTSTSGNGVNWTFSGAACPGQPPAAGLSTGKMNLQSGKLNLR